MKVLQINSVCGIRSTGRICTDLASFLEKEGHDCKIAFGRESAPNFAQKYAVKIGTDLDVKLHGVLTRAFDMHGFGSRYATERFIYWVKEYDPDLIHLHNIHGYYINIEVLFNYIKSSEKPVIWTLHDCWAFTGHCAYFDYVGCDRWKTGCHNCPQKLQYPSSLMFDYSEASFVKKRTLFSGGEKITIVTPSHWLAGLVNQSYLNEYPIKVIHNDINRDIFKPTRSDLRDLFGLGDKKIILGVASVWDKRKGLEYFLRLADELGGDCQVVLIGLTQKQKESLPRNVIGIIRTNDPTELAQWYTAANVYVNPTLEDNYPSTNLEAKACGTPVVTFSTGGCAEAIETGQGIIIGKGDFEGLKSSIMQLKEQLNRGNSNHIERTVEEYRNLYERSIQ